MCEMEESADWQNGCPDLKSRGQHLLETELWADCRFLLGNEPNHQIISGHKLILAMASPVFERMFYGNLQDKNDPIQIPDVLPDAFRSMMKYIYTDKINISSFDEACELCYVGKKYLLPHIVEKCIQYLLADLRPRNVCRAYEFAKLFEEPKLMSRCMQMISTDTRKVLAEPSFNEIDLSTLVVIFGQEYLYIDSELELFNALTKYAQERGFIEETPSTAQSASTSAGFLEPSTSKTSDEFHEMAKAVPKEDNVDVDSDSSCAEGPPHHKKRAKNPKTDENKLMGEILIKEAAKKIRFLTLAPQQFADGPACSSLLTQAEALAILVNISSPSTSKYPMPEGFSISRIPRNCRPRVEDRFDDGHQSPVMLLEPTSKSFRFRPESPNNINSRRAMPFYDCTIETRKFYCVRTKRSQMDYRNASVTDCALTFDVDTNIVITGIQVPTQVLCGELMRSDEYAERYAELLYAHLLDAQDCRLVYTHCTSLVRYDSLLEISFDRPFPIHRHKKYRIGVSFNKVGWYPMYACHTGVTCDGVRFSFNIGAPHESVRDGLIRAIVFTHPTTEDSPYA